MIINLFLLLMMMMASILLSFAKKIYSYSYQRIKKNFHHIHAVLIAFIAKIVPNCKKRQESSRQFTNNSINVSSNFIRFFCVVCQNIIKNSKIVKCEKNRKLLLPLTPIRLSLIVIWLTLHDVSNHVGVAHQRPL